MCHFCKSHAQWIPIKIAQFNLKVSKQLISIVGIYNRKSINKPSLFEQKGGRILIIFLAASETVSNLYSAAVSNISLTTSVCLVAQKNCAVRFWLGISRPFVSVTSRKPIVPKLLSNKRPETRKAWLELGNLPPSFLPTPYPYPHPHPTPFLLYRLIHSLWSSKLKTEIFLREKRYCFLLWVSKHVSNQL